MPPKLSVIIPAYNTAKYIEECVDSVISGTYRDLEVLLVDDGSTDGTGRLCDRLAEKYSSIRVFHTNNRGLSEARNLGIEHATGQYIGFVDSDDVVAPNMFQTMVRYLTSDVQLVVCRYLRYQEDDVKLIGKQANSINVVNQAGAMERLIQNEYGPFVWNKLFSKKILDTKHIRFPKDRRICEDLFFTWEYIKHCKKAVFIEDSLYFYIMHNGSIMNTFRQSRTVDRRYVDLPRGWRYCAETVEEFSPELMNIPKARAAMFYQTVLRKLENPEIEYIEEAITYVKQNKAALCRYRWGWKYYLSAIVLCMSYSCWAEIFRKPLRLVNREEIK